MKSLPLIVVGIVTFLGAALLTLWLQGTFRLPTTKAFTHMHCPECGLEMVYQSHLDGKPCTQCGAGGPKLVNTAGPWADRLDAGGRGSKVGNFAVAGIIGLAAGGVAAYCMILYSQARQTAAEEESKRPLVCHCPFCSRKIGYTSTKSGTTAVCPRCKTAFTLPERGVTAEV